MKYFVVNRWVMDKPVAEFATMDAAFHEAAKASKRDFGSIFLVWNWDGKERRVRAFGHAGVARWSKPCPHANYDGSCSSLCLACNGVGHVEYTS